MTATVRFVGSGDSFGSGGRFQTCIMVDAGGTRFTMDFGTSSLIALRQQDIDPNSIDVILLTHLHGDHCGGVPFLLVDAMLASKRDRPLIVAGPRDLRLPHVHDLRSAVSGHARDEAEVRSELDRAGARRAHPGRGTSWSPPVR